LKRGKRDRERERKRGKKRKTGRKIDSGGKYTGILYAALAQNAGIVSVIFPNQLFTDSLKTIVLHCTTFRPLLSYFSRIILVEQMRMQYPRNSCAFQINE